MLKPTIQNIISAADLIRRFQGETPCILQPDISRLIGSETYVKIEYLNPVRSFKLRGAVNLIQQLKKFNNINRVLTASTGNHGAAMAFACQEFEVPITIGVPVLSLIHI